MTSKIPVLFSGAKHGWWDNNGAIGGALAAYKAKGAASLADSYINLVQPGAFNLTAPDAPSLFANGWLFNGSSNYLLTGIFMQPSWTMIAQFSSYANNGYLMGDFGGYAMQPNRAGNLHRWRGGGQVDKSPAYTSGNFCMAGTQYCYIDGVLDHTIASATASVSAYVFPLGALVVSGTIGSFSACYIQAAAFYSITLSAGDVQTIAAAMAAL